MRNIPKSYIYFALVICFFILILAVILIFPEKEQTTEKPPIIPTAPSPTSSIARGSSKIKPILINELPYKPVGDGGGVNLESPVVQQSQGEVTKILPFLPYETSLQTPKGEIISILIPGAQFQTTPWVLDVQIFGIDYQVNKGDTDYDVQKNLFIEATTNVFNWLEISGVDPRKIIINWGDKAYIRESAEEWLNQ